MTTGQIVFLSLIAINALIPLLVGFFDKAIKFWTRGDKCPTLMFKLQRLKWGDSNMQVFSAWGSLLFCDILNVMLAGVAICAVDHKTGGMLLNTTSLIIAIIGVVVFFTPRYIFDIAKGLRYNPKSGDAERISELEERLHQLESKD